MNNNLSCRSFLKGIALTGAAMLLLSASFLFADSLATEVTFLTADMIPNTPDPGNTGKSSDLFWVCDIQICGPYVVVSNRMDWFCVFERDSATADFSYKSSRPGKYHTTWGWCELTAKELVSHDWAVYAYYAQTSYLVWYKLNKATGIMDSLGGMSVKGNGLPMMMPDKKRLYISNSGNADAMKLNDTTGKPTLTSSSTSAGVGIPSPDGKFYYAVGPHTITVYSMNAANGALTQVSTTASGSVIDGTNVFNYFGQQQAVFSPDGKHFYESNGSDLAVFERDGTTGALTYKTTQDMSTGTSNIRCALKLVFNADGKSGYFVSAGESCANGASACNCTGWFTRDVSTGTLTYAGTSADGNYWSLDLDPVNGNHFSIIKRGPDQVCSFKTPASPGSSVAEQGVAALEIATLSAQPNPFNPGTILSYSLHASYKHAMLSLYNMNGSRVAAIPVQYARGSVTWNASSQASGIYLAKLEADGRSVTAQKIMLLK